MASDFNNVRRELQESAAEQDSGNLFFVLMLVAVIAIGGAAGYWLWPRTDGAAPIVQVETSTPVVKLSKSELKKARRAELTKFQETQAKLLSCARTQRHMMNVYEQYNARNLKAYEGWFQVLDPVKSLSKMGEMNALEANAFMLTQGNGAVRDAMQDIQMQLSAGQASVTPIECGQLNAQVQRRTLDLAPVPTT